MLKQFVFVIIIVIIVLFIRGKKEKNCTNIWYRVSLPAKELKGEGKISALWIMTYKVFVKYHGSPVQQY